MEIQINGKTIRFGKDSNLVNVADLVPYKKNPKNHTDKDIDLIIKSIERNGFGEHLLVCPETMEVLSGNGRLLAAKKMGLEQVPVVYAPSGLSEKQKADLVIASNKLVEVSGYNDNLGELIAEFDLQMDDFGIDSDMSMVTDMPKLESGEKSPFQQMTFTLADEQVETLKTALEKAKGTTLYADESISYGNTNSNGNALFVIVLEWLNGNS